MLKGFIFTDLELYVSSGISGCACASAWFWRYPQESFSINKTNEEIKENSIYTSKKGDKKFYFVTSDWAYGDYNSMKIYCDVYYNLLNLIKSGKIQYFKKKYPSETILRVHIESHNLNIIKTHEPYTINKNRLK